MVKHLHSDFLTDPNVYVQAEAYWQNRWNELVKFAGKEGQWQTPWLRTAFADGTPFRDGDPIFSAISTVVDRAVRVIQYPPESDGIELDYWVEWFGPENEHPPVQILVVSCALSMESAAQACEAIYSWIVEGRVVIRRPYSYEALRVAPPVRREIPAPLVPAA
jgi:hypothetical protein